VTPEQRRKTKEGRQETGLTVT